MAVLVIRYSSIVRELVAGRGTGPDGFGIIALPCKVDSEHVRVIRWLLKCSAQLRREGWQPL